MSVITKVLKQTAVYWGPPIEGGDGDFGTPEPVEISCRWDAIEGEVEDPRTHDKQFNSMIMVDRDVEVGGRLYLGTLDSLSAGEITNPDQFVSTKIIVGFKKIPNFKNTEFYREAQV